MFVNFIFMYDHLGLDRTLSLWSGIIVSRHLAGKIITLSQILAEMLVTISSFCWLLLITHTLNFQAPKLNNTYTMRFHLSCIISPHCWYRLNSFVYTSGTYTVLIITLNTYVWKSPHIYVSPGEQQGKGILNTSAKIGRKVVF